MDLLLKCAGLLFLYHLILPRVIKKNLGEYIQFLCIADASGAELETQILLTKDLFPRTDYSKAESLLEEVQKMLIVMIKKLNAKR